MPQILHHDPTTLRVGDILWTIGTQRSFSDRSDGMLEMHKNFKITSKALRVIKIVEELKENNTTGLGGPRKRAWTYHLVNSAHRGGDEPTKIVATHKDLLFDEFDDMIKWMRGEISTWQRLRKEHIERRDDLDEILYINDNPKS